jgi:urease accessory protein
MGLRFKHFLGQNAAIGLVLGSLSWAIAAEPAAAHHATGGRMPSNLFEGFLSGLAHPMIGLDHFAFVVAVGLLASFKPKWGLLIPIAFVLSTLAGTGLHLLGLDLPVPEVFISASVFVVGLLLAANYSPQLGGAIALVALAGVFHGYAYGESIVGAQMTPLLAYLAGFATIQLAIALAICYWQRAALAFGIDRSALKSLNEPLSLYLRFAGFTLCGAGAVFLSSAILG